MCLGGISKSLSRVSHMFLFGGIDGSWVKASGTFGYFGMFFRF